MGKFYKGGRLWSAEAFRLQNSRVLSDSSQVSLALQQYPLASGDAAVVLLASDSAADAATIAATPRTLVGTITGAGGSPTTGDTLRLSIDSAQYGYTLTGAESGPADVYAGLAAVVTAANGGDGDPTFTVTGGSSEIDIAARVAGTAANGSELSLDWVFAGSGTATTTLTNTNGIDGSTGSGMTAVEVQYLDADFNVQTEVVNLNGTTAVSTTGLAVWVQRLRWAAGNQPAGTILAVLGDAPVSTILPNTAVSQTLGYCVPANKQLRLIAALGTASVATRVSIVSNRDTDSGVTMPCPVTAADFLCSTQPQDVELPYHVGPFPAGTTVRVFVQGITDTLVTVALDAYLEAEGTAN